MARGGTAGGLRHNIDNNDHQVSTNAISGTTTVPAGGSTTLALSGSGSGSGTGEGSGSGTIDLSDAIQVGYGPYRAPVSQTYDLADLEMQVNGLGLDGDGEWDGAFWISLDEGIPTGDYYEIDITGACANSALANRPFQQNNLIEVRRKGDAGTIPVTEINSDGTKAVISTSPDEHGLEVGDVVTISGTTNYNGTYVIAVSEALFFEVDHTYTGSEMGGTITVNKSAMILGMLGVATTIQALHYS